MTDEEALKLLGHIKGHVARLKENFDHVQIFAVKFDSQEGSRHFSYGEGDYYGRFGHISLWLENEKEWERLKASEH